MKKLGKGLAAVGTVAAVVGVEVVVGTALIIGTVVATSYAWNKLEGYLGKSLLDVGMDEESPRRTARAKASAR